MKHPRLQQFDNRLKELFDEVDDYLEQQYGEDYPLHPARARAGKTANKEHSGLFTVGASFSAGYGSEHGRGYVVEVEIVTLADIPDEVEEEIDEAAARKVRELLPRYFPDRRLELVRDGRLFKISGDLSLGSHGDGGRG